MKRPCIVLSIVLGCIFSFSVSALAGIEPSPFKDQVDAITMHVKSLRTQLEKRLSSPMGDDTMPAEVRKSVAEIHGITGAIMDLNTISNQIAIDSIMCPGCEVMGFEPSPFKQLKRQVTKLISSIDEFLSLATSGEIYAAAKVVGANQNLRAQAVILKKTVKEIIDYMNNIKECIVDEDCGCNGDAAACRGFKSQEICNSQIGCNWIVDGENNIEYCWFTGESPIECSDIPFDQCKTRYPCYTMRCVNGLCQY